MSDHDLDLYRSNIDWQAWKRIKHINWRRAIGVLTTISVIVAALGFFGYRWMTNLTPVSRDKALDMYQQESAQNDAQASADKKTSKSGGTTKKTNASDNSKDSGTGGGGSSPSTVAAAAGSGKSSPSQSSKAARSNNPYGRSTPEEGVYSWATDGWEEAAGIRREFPEESQRIITASDGDSWKQHHYFSEEREIWSEFVRTEEGAHLASQRNRAKFGPVTNDSTVDFNPPMLVGPSELEVGTTWNGTWEGKTSGSYTARLSGHGQMNIDGKIVEFYEFDYRMELRGELDGTVIAKVRLAPKYALTVYEHYTQDLQSERGRYRADWEMTVKSVVPQR